MGIGFKIKDAAKIIFIISVVLSILSSIFVLVIMLKAKELGLAEKNIGLSVVLFLVTMAVGMLISYVSYLLLLGFGEIVQRVSNIDDKIQIEKNKSKTNEKDSISLPSGVFSSSTKSNTKVANTSNTVQLSGECYLCKKQKTSLQKRILRHDGKFIEALVCEDCLKEKNL